MEILIEPLSVRLGRHATHLVTKEGTNASELRDDLMKAAYIVQMHEQSGLPRKQIKKTNQRTQLRQLHRAHMSNLRMLESYIDRNRILTDQLNKNKKELYDINRIRSNEAGSWVSRCWGCRFRNWYQTMTGQAYPDYEGRRFHSKGNGLYGNE